MKELFVAFYKKSICSLITVMDGIGPYSSLKIKSKQQRVFDMSHILKSFCVSVGIHANICLR